MKTIIENSKVGNILPSIAIQLSRSELAELVRNNFITQDDMYKPPEEGKTYYRNTKITVSEIAH